MTEARSTVLVVEDEALLLFAIADELRLAGFEVLEANTAEGALQLLETHESIGVLFSDIDMPGRMDGVKLTKTVRARWPPVKVVLTSGKPIPSHEIYPVGDVFLPKPYQPEIVAATIERLL